MSQKDICMVETIKEEEKGLLGEIIECDNMAYEEEIKQLTACTSSQAKTIFTLVNRNEELIKRNAKLLKTIEEKDKVIANLAEKLTNRPVPQKPFQPDCAELPDTTTHYRRSSRSHTRLRIIHHLASLVHHNPIPTEI